MKPPYKLDPTPLYEVPFDNPDLVAKANKNGTIIVNKDRVRDKKLMDEAMSHEKQHLKDMQDGKLDYDNLSVTFKGKRYSRDSFDEGNENLPWEKRAYAAGRKRKKIDLTPKKKKLTGPPAMSDGKPLLVDNTSSPFQALDENEVNMNESFGPSLELDEIAEQLDKAVVAHKEQAEGVRKHMEEMQDMQKGSALHSPIKMWGAPAFEEGKDSEPSGGSEEEKLEEKTTRTHVRDINPETGMKRLTITTTRSGGGKSYEEAYADVDKSKYPTLESFIDAAERYKEKNVKVSEQIPIRPAVLESPMPKPRGIEIPKIEVPGEEGDKGGGGGRGRKPKPPRFKPNKQSLSATDGDTQVCRIDEKGKKSKGCKNQPRRGKVIRKGKRQKKKLFRSGGLY